MSATPANKIDPAHIVGHFVNGEELADDNRPLPVTNPATGQVIRHVAMASEETVTAAIAAAQAAFPAWRDTPPARRARIMFRFKQLLEENADLIAAAITEEHGKVLDDAMGEFGRGVEVPTMVIFLGAIGGMLSMGIVGLFVGAVVLALGYELFIAWLDAAEADAVAQAETGA